MAFQAYESSDETLPLPVVQDLDGRLQPDVSTDTSKLSSLKQTKGSVPKTTHLSLRTQFGKVIQIERNRNPSD